MTLSLDSLHFKNNTYIEHQNAFIIKTKILN